MSHASPSPTCEAILAEMSRVKARDYNPAALSVADLRAGDYVVIPPSALAEYKGARGFAYALRMRVVRIATRSRFRQSAGNSTTIYLEHPELGSFGISPSHFEAVPTFEDLRPPDRFALHEFVQVGHEESWRGEYKVIHETKRQIFVIDGPSYPFIGRYLGEWDETHDAISVVSVRGKVKDAPIEVPRGDVTPLPLGTSERCCRVMAVPLNLKVEFKRNEQVVYRDLTGKLRRARFKNRIGEVVHLLEGRERITSTMQDVHAIDHAVPSTPNFEAAWNHLNPDLSGELTRHFFNAALRLASLPDFQSRSELGRMAVLMEYLGTVVEWRRAATLIEDALITDLNGVLCAGAGVCRHLVILLATLMTEAGLEPRIVSAQVPGQLKGHAWIEVELTDRLGQRRSFVIDPSTDLPILRFDHAYYVVTRTNAETLKLYFDPQRSYTQGQAGETTRQPDVSTATP